MFWSICSSDSSSSIAPTHVQFLGRARKLSGVSRPPELCRAAAQGRHYQGPPDLSRPRQGRPASVLRRTIAAASGTVVQFARSLGTRSAPREKSRPCAPAVRNGTCSFVGLSVLACLCGAQPPAASLRQVRRWPRQRPRIPAQGTPQGELKSALRRARRRGLQGQEIPPPPAQRTAIPFGCPPEAALGPCVFQSLVVTPLPALRRAGDRA